MRVDILRDAGILRHLLDDLPSPFPVDVEYWIVFIYLSVIGVALEPVRQVIRAGNHTGLFSFAGDEKNCLAFLDTDFPGGETQGLGDPQARLVKKQDQERVTFLVAAGNGVHHLPYLIFREIGHDEEGLRECRSVCGDERGALRHNN